jgi:hypothetical protein
LFYSGPSYNMECVVVEANKNVGPSTRVKRVLCCVVLWWWLKKDVRDDA